MLPWVSRISCQIKGLANAAAAAGAGVPTGDAGGAAAAASVGEDGLKRLLAHLFLALADGDVCNARFLNCFDLHIRVILYLLRHISQALYL